MHILINNNKIPLVECNTFNKKLKGLMFKKNIDYALKIRCNGIHTFFMRENIDIVLTDKNNNVLYIYRNFKKRRVILPKKDVYYTYELPNNTVDNNIKKIIIKDE